ncbi:MAG: sugar-binding protein [Candidatus Hydrogenedentes bacterium]|nr:sugar-binding protein [Candidatus Hydrogenedentota bacterium]
MRKAGIACILMGVVMAGCTKVPETASDTGAPAESDPIQLAFVTNGVDPFWNIATAGVRTAEQEFGVTCEVLMPPKGIVDQKRMIESALSNGIDGLAISPIDAANQVAFINDACKVTKVITQDSDAPDSERLCFVGMDNYKAGREAGKLVKEALPEGGKVMIYVGRLEQLNSQQRRQGVIDELLDRPIPAPDAIQYDPPGGEIVGERYTILGTRTDSFDYAKAKSNAEDTIASVPDIGCMVGLWAYNVPACLAAVKEANKVGKIQLVSFDEDNATLQGIADGAVHGTISQQPYEYGYHSVRILAGLARGDETVLPENDFYEVPIVVVKKDNVEAFRTKLAELRGE